MKQPGLLVAAVDHDDPEDFYAVQTIGFGFQEGSSLLDGGLDQGIVMHGVRNRGPVVFEQNLIETARVIEGTQRSFEPPDCIIPPSVVPAFVIDAADP